MVKKSHKEMAEMSKGPRVNEFISFQKSINDYSDVHVNGRSHQADTRVENLESLLQARSQSTP